MLYQPTNISPSMAGALGNGVIDANNSLTVSWQVNGNSPMTAFQITIYANNAISTQLFSTGKLTYGCPFYGVDYAGNVQMFNYTIYHEQLSLAKIENGRDYKIIIQQWWNETDSVTQSSASVFRARSTPTLAIGTIPKPLKSRLFTFTASYTQEQGDALNWCRWRISSSDEKEEIILEDTGRIYGTAELTFPYDGFLNGRTYLIECLVQTENGVETSSFAYVSVQYTVNPIQANLTVCQSTRGNGITVKLPEIKRVPGVKNSQIKISDSYLTLPSDENAKVVWSTENGAPLSIKQPFDICWHGKGLPEGNVLSLKCKASVNGFSPIKVTDSPSGYPFGTYGAACVFTGESTQTYVIVLRNGSEWYSNDLQTWLYSGNVLSGTNSDWCGIAYGNSKYAAVSRGDKKIAYATSANAWSISTSSIGLSTICFGNHLFVAAGEGIVYTRSTANDKGWVETEAPFSGTPTTIAFGEIEGTPKYVVGTEIGNLYVSPDGTTWTLSASGQGFLSSITFFNGKFYVARNDGNSILASSDGTQWNILSHISEFINGTSSICGDSTGHLYATENENGNYAYSSDYGKTWSVFPLGTPLNDAFLFEGANRVFLVGDGESSGTTAVYAGGSELVTQEAMFTTNVTSNVEFLAFENIMPSKSNWRDVCYGNGKYVAVATDSNKAAYSTTGTKWDESTLHESVMNWASICYGNGVFVAAGVGYFATSADAINWTATASAGNTFTCIRFLNGKFYAVGTGIYRSSDGATWEKCNVPSGNGYMIMSIAYGNGMYVCVTTNYAVYSYDGLNWSYTPMPQGSWRSILFGNGVFIASGLFSYSVYSYDGKTWSAASIPSGQTEGLGTCFGDGRFIATTAAGVVKSVDGHTWYAVAENNDREYAACCFGNGKFLVVGNTSNVLLSGTVTANVEFLLNGGRQSTTVVPYMQQWTFIIDGELNVLGLSWTTDGKTTANASSVNIAPIAEVTSITAGGAVNIDYIFVSKGYMSEETKRKFENWSNPYHPYDIPRQFYADFTSDLNGDTFGESYFTQLSVYRDQTDASITEHIFNSSATDVHSFIDASARNGVQYRYTAFGLSDFDQSSAITSDVTQICVWNWAILSCTEDSDGVYHPQKIFAFGKNLSSGDISNNNAPQILQNFTRYPTVQPSPFNYKTGTLSSLIGTISNGVYSDTVSERNEIMDLSITQNTLFLKSRKGDLMKIRISGAIESGTMDNSAAQAQTVKIPWVEIGDASEARIIITESDGAWPN